MYECNHQTAAQYRYSALFFGCVCTFCKSKYPSLFSFNKHFSQTPSRSYPAWPLPFPRMSSLTSTISWVERPPWGLRPLTITTTGRRTERTARMSKRIAHNCLLYLKIRGLIEQTNMVPSLPWTTLRSFYSNCIIYVQLKINARLI